MYDTTWTRGVSLEARPALEREIKADACVIGGGLCGVLTAHYLKEAGLRVVLLEAERLGYGTTSRTTGKLTAQHGLVYHQLIEKHGIDRARLYAEANLLAVGEYKRLERAAGADFGLCERASWLYAVVGKSGKDALERERDACEQCGLSVELRETSELPFRALGLRMSGQAAVDPMKVIAALSPGLEVYENSRALRVDGGRVETARGAVECECVLFATRFPFVNFPGFYFMREHQERDYVLELRGEHSITENYLGVEEAGLSLRPVDRRTLLLGGGSHRSGDGECGRYSALRSAAARYFPNLCETAAWSAEDCITLDGLPYVGKFSATADGWLVASGFGKWGMSGSMAAALLLRDLALGRKNPYAELYDPGRFRPSASAKELMREVAESSKGLARGAFALPDGFADELRRGQAAVVALGGRKVGAYRDEGGELHIVNAHCAHLGCELVWNADEKSWDCPCHGSRFGYLGAPLDPPATSGIAVETRTEM